MLSQAFAGATVVHDVGDSEALPRVAGAAGVPAADLSATPVNSLVARVPVGLGNARVVPCTEAPVEASVVVAHLDKAEGGIGYMEYESAKQELALAAAGLNCLADPLDPQVGARTFYLRGIVAFAEGDAVAAEDHFYRARVFVPTLAWDEDFAPDARPLFDKTGVQIRTSDPAWLELVPAPAPGSLLVDGRVTDSPEGKLALAPGPHILQFGKQNPITLTVDMKAGNEGTLVVPALLPSDVLSWAADDMLRASLSKVFAATLQRDATVYVTWNEGVWQVRAGRNDWVELAPPRKAVAEKAPRPPREPAEGGKGGKALAIAGGTLLVAGGAYAGLNMATAWSAYDAGTNAATWDDYLAAKAEYDPAKQKMLIGDGVAVAGATLLGVGLVIHF